MGKQTINMSGALTELLHKHGYDDVIAGYRRLLERGQIELTESACYHPFLPLLPKAEIVRQIKLNHDMNSRHFGSAYQPKGFYAPEMVYTPELAVVVKELGYQWVLIDEISFPGTLPIGETKIYQSTDVPGLDLFIRNRKYSFEILSAQIDNVTEFQASLGDLVDKNAYLITGMDGETFGHHRLGLERLLGALMKSLPTATISELYDEFKDRESIAAQSGSWALLSIEEARRDPFSRWFDRTNKIHELQWELTKLALKAGQDQPDGESRTMLDKALHSDQYWWASAKPWWSLEMIERGANDLVETITTVPNISEEIKTQAKGLYFDIVTTGFRWQREGVVDRLVKEFVDEEAHYRIQSGMIGQSSEKIDGLIQDLERQLDKAVVDKEYNRAAEFQRRIKELISEKDNIHGRAGSDGENDSDWGV